MAEMLAQTNPLNVIVPLVFVIVVTAGLLAVLAVVRRRLNKTEVESDDFSLSQLRALHKQGKLSDEEFERARGKMIALTHQKIAREAAKTDTPKSPATQPKLTDE